MSKLSELLTILAIVRSFIAMGLLRASLQVMRLMCAVGMLMHRWRRWLFRDEGARIRHEASSIKAELHLHDRLSQEHSQELQARLAALRLANDAYAERVGLPAYDNAIINTIEWLQLRNNRHGKRTWELLLILAEGDRATMFSKLLFWTLVSSPWQDESMGDVIETARMKAGDHKGGYARHFNREMRALLRDRIAGLVRPAAERVTMWAAIYDLVNRLFGPKQ